MLLLLFHPEIVHFFFGSYDSITLVFKRVKYSMPFCDPNPCLCHEHELIITPTLGFFTLVFSVSESFHSYTLWHFVHPIFLFYGTPMVNGRKFHFEVSWSVALITSYLSIFVICTVIIESSDKIMVLYRPEIELK